MGEKELKRFTYLEVRKIRERSKRKQRHSYSDRAPEKLRFDNQTYQHDRAAIEHFERDRNDD
jgi:hypothetical protein